MAYAPPVLCTQLHKHTRRLLERPLGVDEARASVFGRPIARARRRRYRAVGRAKLGLLVPRPYRGGGEPPSLDGRAAYLRRARGRPPACRARALAFAWARASAAISALVIALVKAGARVARGRREGVNEHAGGKLPSRQGRVVRRGGGQKRPNPHAAQRQRCGEAERPTVIPH